MFGCCNHDGEQPQLQVQYQYEPGQVAENYLRSRRQGQGESLRELGQAVRVLVTLAYPEFDEESKDRLARAHYTDAIELQSVREGIFSTDNVERMEVRGKCQRKQRFAGPVKKMKTRF